MVKASLANKEEEGEMWPPLHLLTPTSFSGLSLCSKDIYLEY